MSTHRQYDVQKCKLQASADSLWQGAFWRDVPALSIDNHMGPLPDHFPRALARISYDDDNLYVIFRVNDRYVKCLAAKYGDPVWQDSCVEFFFTAHEDPSRGYFNIETNACGVMLMAHQKARDVELIPIAQSDAARIRVQHSLPDHIESEISDPIEWTLQYTLPLDILSSYAEVTKPAPGVIWRANFYKCGDKTAKPHWLTWSKIDWPEPDFHRPEFFGTLIFQ